MQNHRQRLQAFLEMCLLICGLICHLLDAMMALDDLDGLLERSGEGELAGLGPTPIPFMEVVSAKQQMGQLLAQSPTNTKAGSKNPPFIKQNASFTHLLRIGMQDILLKGSSQSCQH